MAFHICCAGAVGGGERLTMEDMAHDRHPNCAAQERRGLPDADAGEPAGGATLGRQRSIVWPRESCCDEQPAGKSQRLLQGAHPGLSQKAAAPTL